MAILVHYHTATRETIVPIKKRSKAVDSKRKSGDGEFGPPADHPDGCRCAECRQWWGRDSAMDAKSKGAWDEVEKAVAKVADASKSEIEEFIARAKKAGKTPEQVESALRTWTADHAKKAADDDDDSSPTVDSADLNLGAPVNEEWLRLNAANPDPAANRVQLDAKFTAAQISAWVNHF